MSYLFNAEKLEVFKTPIHQSLPVTIEKTQYQTVENKLRFWNKNRVKGTKVKDAYSRAELQQLAKILGLEQITNLSKQFLAEQILQTWETRYPTI